MSTIQCIYSRLFFDSIHIHTLYSMYIVSHIFVYNLEKCPHKIAKFVHQKIVVLFLHT